VTTAFQIPGRAGKSSNNDFRRLTVYTKRETVMTLKRLQLDTGKDISDLVQEALDAWLAGFQK